MSGDGCLPARAVQRAQLLVGAVRDRDKDDVAAVLTRLPRRELYGLAVTLAAMLPVDSTPSELLAWNDSEVPIRLLTPRPPLLPHGTHAAYNRHRNNGEQACPTCLAAESDYTRTRMRKTRALRSVAS